MSYCINNSSYWLLKEKPNLIGGKELNKRDEYKRILLLIKLLIIKFTGYTEFTFTFNVTPKFYILLEIYLITSLYQIKKINNTERERERESESEVSIKNNDTVCVCVCARACMWTHNRSFLQPNNQIWFIAHLCKSDTSLFRLSDRRMLLLLVTNKNLARKLPNEVICRIRSQ